MTTEQERSEYILEFRSRAEKLQSQKDLLLKQLNSAEQALEATVNMYARYFPPVMDYIKDGNSSFIAALEAVSKAMKQREPISKIELLLSRVQTVMLKESKKLPFSDFFKNPKNAAGAAPDEYMESIKIGYITLINSMKGTFDSSYGVKLNQIAAEFQNVHDFDSIQQLQDDFFSLIQQYIYNIASDKEKIASFVNEVVKRILQIEAGINQSFTHTRTAIQSNEDFGTFLNREIGCLKTNLDVSEHLEDLKNQVSQTLSSIEIALKEKTSKDETVKNLSEKKHNEFQTGFSKLKKELNQAIKHSRDLETKLNQDPLTKAYNRRAYQKRITSEMERFLRYQTIFSILVLDIDFFKKVNDTYGHAIGDKCLQEITRRTAPLLRKNDMFARYGGEEFVIIMPETPAKGASIVAEKIRQTIEKIEFVYKKEVIKMTISIGVSQAMEGDKTHETVFERTDAALYRAKNEGRNRVVTEYPPS